MGFPKLTERAVIYNVLHMWPLYGSDHCLGLQGPYA